MQSYFGMSLASLTWVKKRVGPFEQSDQDRTLKDPEPPESGLRRPVDVEAVEPVPVDVPEPRRSEVGEVLLRRGLDAAHGARKG